MMRTFLGNFLVLLLSTYVVTISLSIMFDDSLYRGHNVIINIISSAFSNIMHVIPLLIFITSAWTKISSINNREFIILQQLGLSYQRLLVPQLYCVIIIGLITVTIIDPLVCIATKHMTNIKTQDDKQITKSLIYETGISITLTSSERNMETSTPQKPGANLRDVAFFVSDDDSIILHLLSKTAAFSGTYIHFHDAKVTSFDQETLSYSKQHVARFIYKLDPAAIVKLRDDSSPATISLPSLFNFIKELKKYGIHDMEYRINMHERLSVVVTFVILFLMGTIFINGTYPSWRNSFRALIVAIALCIPFIAVTDVITSNGHIFNLSIFSIVWFPQLLMLSLLTAWLGFTIIVNDRVL